MVLHPLPHFVLYLSKHKIKEIACVAEPRTDPRND